MLAAVIILDIRYLALIAHGVVPAEGRGRRTLLSWSVPSARVRRAGEKSQARS